MTRSLRRNFNLLILQQRVYIANLITLLESFEEEDIYTLTNHLKQIEQVFNDMDIRYKHDPENERITSVRMKTSYIPQLQVHRLPDNMLLRLGWDIVSIL